MRACPVPVLVLIPVPELVMFVVAPALALLPTLRVLVLVVGYKSSFARRDDEFGV